MLNYVHLLLLYQSFEHVNIVNISIYKNISAISVETDNNNNLNFYKKYLNFEIVGIRRRLPKKLFLLIKNF